MKNLTNWVFTYNEYREVYQAAKREDYNLLFSDQSNEKVLSSSSIHTLFELIDKTNGDPLLVKQLLHKGVNVY